MEASFLSGKLAWIKELAHGALDLWFPPHCEGCGLPIAADFFCARCKEALPWIHLPRCRQCSFPFDGEMADLPDFDCHDCRERKFSFDFAVSAFRFRGPIRRMILDLKYHGQTRLAGPLGRGLAKSLDSDPRLAGIRIDALVPAPLHPVRFRDRGFNQAALIAEVLSDELGIPVLDCLLRTRYTSTQTARDRYERMENLKGAFSLRPGSSVRGMKLLIVDDVFTTGSTIEACSRVLKKNRAIVIVGATLARG